MLPSGRDRLITSACWVTANDWYQQVSVECPVSGLGGGRPVVHCLLCWGQCHRDHSYTPLPRLLITSGSFADTRPGGIFDIEILSRLCLKFQG